LEPRLERLLVLIVRGIFNGDSTITLTDFAALLRFALSLRLYIFKLRGSGWIRDKFHNAILRYSIHVSTTTPGKSILGGFGHDY
jgi:hypothetical protein